MLAIDIKTMELQAAQSKQMDIKRINIIFIVEEININQAIEKNQFNFKQLSLLIDRIINQKNLDKQKISAYVKDGQKFIKFQEQKCSYLLKEDHITIQILYKRKIYQFERKVNRSTQNVQEQLSLMKQINQAYKKGVASKAMLIRRISSSRLIDISQNMVNNFNKKEIHVTLLISDPLVAEKQQSNEAKIEGCSFEEHDCEQHLKMLQQASAHSKSLRIEVNKQIAFLDKMNGMFPKSDMSATAHSKIIRVVTFITRVIRKQDFKLYISFENSQILGQQKLVKADSFFNVIVPKLNIQAMIIVGANTNCLSIYKAQFPIILISTYSFNIDKGIRCFMQSFYSSLFQKKQIKQSYDLALNHYKKIFFQKKYPDQYLCCCLHQHKPYCSWSKIIGKIGLSLAHKIFNHQNMGSYSDYFILKLLQEKLYDNESKQKCCTSSYQRCCAGCKTNKVSKSKILLKFSYIQPNTSVKLWIQDQETQNYQKNKLFISQNVYRTISQRINPVVIYKIIQKIIKGKGVLSFIGNKRRGKGYFIQASRAYIQQRRNDFKFQYVQFTQSSLQSQIDRMYKVSKSQSFKFKKLIFIQNCYSISFQTEVLKKIRQKKINKNVKNLPFILIIKVIRPEISQNSVSFESQDCVNIQKLSKVQIFIEVLSSLHFQEFSTQKQIKFIFKFCQQYEEKLNYKEVRNFLKYFKEKYILNRRKNLSLINQYNLRNGQFETRMKVVKQKSSNFYQFIGFLTQFEEGFYLIKLNRLILSWFFDMNQIKNFLKKSEYTYKILDINTTIIKSKNRVKCQEVTYVLPSDNLVRHFQSMPHYKILKYKYFERLFQVLWKIIYTNKILLLQKMKISTQKFVDGIFMFQIEANKTNQRTEIIQKISNSIIFFYVSKNKLPQKYEQLKAKGLNQKINNQQSFSILKNTFTMFFQQIQRYLLHHHSANLSKMINTYQRVLKQHSLKGQFSSSKKQILEGQFCRLNLLIICKKALMIYQIVLKESFYYSNLNIRITLQNRVRDISQVLHQQIKSKLRQKNVNFNEEEKFKEEKSLQYFYQIICLIQLQVLLGTDLVSLPQGLASYKAKSAQNLPSLRFKQFQYKKKFSYSQKIHILKCLINYQKNKIQINKILQDNQKLTDVRIQFIIITINHSFSYLQKVFEFYSSSQLLKKLMIKQHNYLMQVIRHIMNAIKIYFFISKNNKLDNKNVFLRNKYSLRYYNDFLNKKYQELRLNYHDKSKVCYKNQDIRVFLENAQLFKVYLKFVLQNDQFNLGLKNLEQSIYKQNQVILQFLKQKNCRKIIFNSQNLVIFMKSKVIMLRNDPYVFIRKKNFTMQYIKQILQNRQVKFSYFALNQQNFSLLQIDSQNKKCEIYYLVLTVDTIIENDEIFLLFQNKQGISQDLIQLQQFIKKIKQMKILFLLIVGQNSQSLCQEIYKKLQNPPIIISLSHKSYNLKNYFTKNNKHSMQQQKQQSTGLQYQNKINEYFKVEACHLMLDMAICQIIKQLTLMSDENAKRKISIDSENQNQLDEFKIYEEINTIIGKSLKKVKGILMMIWSNVQCMQKQKFRPAQSQLQFSYKVFAQNPQQIQVPKVFFNVQSQQQKIILIKKQKTNSKEDQIKQLNIKVLSQSRVRKKSINFSQFSKLNIGQLINLKQKIHQTKNNLQNEVYYQSIGRHIQIRQIIRHFRIKQNKIVLIFGDSCSGKTNLANQICWIIQTRSLFKDGVYKFDMRSLRDNLYTITQYIQIHYIENNLFNILNPQIPNGSNNKGKCLQFLIVFQNLSIIDLKDKQNAKFFQNLSLKQVSLIFTTDQQNIHLELNKIIPLDFSLLKKVQTQNGEFKSSISFEQNSKFDKHNKRNNYDSNNYKDNDKDKKWELLAIDLTEISRDQLFCIALSYLKRKQIYTNYLNLKPLQQKKSFLNTGKNLKQDSSLSYIELIVKIMKQLQKNETSTSTSTQTARQNSIMQYSRSNDQRSSSTQNSQIINTPQLESHKSQTIYFQQNKKVNKTTQNRLRTLITRLQKQFNITSKQDTRFSFYKECFQKLLPKREQNSRQIYVSFNL